MSIVKAKIDFRLMKVTEVTLQYSVYYREFEQTLRSKS